MNDMEQMLFPIGHQYNTGGTWLTSSFSWFHSVIGTVNIPEPVCNDQLNDNGHLANRA
jgi:hypothetical protein